MNHDRLKNILAESKAEFVQGDFWGMNTGDLNGFTRRWEIDRTDAAEAELFLKRFGSVDNFRGDPADRFYSVTNPQVSGGVRDGLHRTGRVTSRVEVDARDQSETWTVYQELRQGYVTTLGTGGTVDWSEFVLLKESGYHANHEMPVLRLNNVAPSAVHDLVAYLNQDTFTDVVFRDDTLSGTWRRVEVLAEQDEDGSYHIDVMLTDSANTSLYVRFLESSNVWKGIYHKWDADETTIEELESTIQFSATGEIVESGGKTLRETVAGRTVRWTPVRRASDTRLYEVVAEILWVREETLHDYARTTNVPIVDEDGETLPRTGNAIVSQWWERGNNTDKLPEKPAALYDAADGTWMEEYIMQSPPEIVNGRYNWLLNCRRVDLPDAFLNAGKTAAKWIKHAVQNRTDKQQNTVSIDSQTVMRLMNGLIDDPSEDVGSLGIPWNSTWDWAANTAYSSGDVRYHEDSATWMKAIQGVPDTGIEITDTAYWEPATTPPSSWDQSVYGVWSPYFGKTYLDDYSTSGVTWNDAWDDFIGLSSNTDINWPYDDDAWNADLYPSEFAGDSAGAGGKTIWFNRGKANGLDELDSSITKGGWVKTSGGVINPYTTGGYPLYAIPGAAADYTNGYFDVGTVLKVSPCYPADGVAGEEDAAAVYFIIIGNNGTNTGYAVLFAPHGDGNSGYGYSIDGVSVNYLAGAVFRFFKSSTSASLINEILVISQTSRDAYVGNKLYPGSALYFSGQNSTAGGTWAYSDSVIADDYGYPYQLAYNSKGINFYLKKEYLFPDLYADPDERSNLSLLPRFSHGKDKYANPNMLEIVRRTRKLIQTEIYRKYCAVHPSLISNAAAYVPAGFAEDAFDWPTDGSGGIELWVDSNILIKYRVSDGPLSVMGAQLYYAECTIEYYGEEEPDAQETSARDGATQRNFPSVDAETGMAMIYFRPKEVGSLFAENSLPPGTTRMAGNRVGEVTKMIDSFEIRGEDPV